MDILTHENKYSGRNAPPSRGLILIDLNIPSLSGRKVLRAIKSSDRLAAIPVVVLTTSGDDRDVEACYAQGATDCNQKSVDLVRIFAAISRFKEDWHEGIGRTGA